MQCISVVVEEKSDFHGVSNLETPPWFHVYPHCMSLLLQIHHIIGYLAVHPVLIVRGWKIPFFSWGHRLKSIRWSLTYSLLKYNFECTTIYIWLVYIPLYIYIYPHHSRLHPPLLVGSFFIPYYIHDSLDKSLTSTTFVAANGLV